MWLRIEGLCNCLPKVLVSLDCGWAECQWLHSLMGSLLLVEQC